MGGWESQVNKTGKVLINQYIYISLVHQSRKMYLLPNYHGVKGGLKCFV